MTSNENKVFQGEDRIIRPRELIRIVGISRPTVDRMEARGEFPRRIQLTGKNVGWRLSDLMAWAESRRRADNSPAQV